MAPNPYQSPEEPSKRRRKWLLAVLLVIALAVIYVLGVGPTAWLVEHGHIEPWIYKYLYAPMRWQIDQSSLMESATDWYFEWWIAP